MLEVFKPKIAYVIPDGKTLGAAPTEADCPQLDWVTEIEEEERKLILERSAQTKRESEEKRAQQERENLEKVLAMKAKIRAAYKAQNENSVICHNYGENIPGIPTPDEYVKGVKIGDMDSEKIDKKFSDAISILRDEYRIKSYIKYMVPSLFNKIGDKINSLEVVCQNGDVGIGFQMPDRFLFPDEYTESVYGDIVNVQTDAKYQIDISAESSRYYKQMFGSLSEPQRTGENIQVLREKRSEYEELMFVYSRKSMVFINKNGEIVIIRNLERTPNGKTYPAQYLKGPQFSGLTNLLPGNRFYFYRGVFYAKDSSANNDFPRVNLTSEELKAKEALIGKLDWREGIGDIIDKSEEPLKDMDRIFIDKDTHYDASLNAVVINFTAKNRFT